MNIEIIRKKGEDYLKLLNNPEGNKKPTIALEKELKDIFYKLHKRDLTSKKISEISGIPIKIVVRLLLEKIHSMD